METAVQNTDVQRKKAAKVLPNLEVSAFCGQMALILQSGISPAEGLSVMMEDANQPEEQALLQRLYESVEYTGDFPGALEETGLFPDYMVQMVRIGDESGTLDTVMNALCVYYEREEAMRRNIRNAVTYPMVMVAMMVVVILVLLVKVMPIFDRVFTQLGAQMTGLSRVLMNVGSGIGRYSAVLLVLLVAAAGIAFWCGRGESGMRFARRIGCRFRFFRGIYERISACRLAGGLALTLGSGLSPEVCLKLASDLVDDPACREKLALCQEKVEQGEDLARTLHEAGVFSGVYARMTIIGGKTGRLDQVMERVAALYQDDIDNRLNNVLAVLEPAIVTGLSLIVGAILLSVMLPLLGIMSGI